MPGRARIFLTSDDLLSEIAQQFLVDLDSHEDSQGCFDYCGLVFQHVESERCLRKTDQDQKFFLSEDHDKFATLKDLGLQTIWLNREGMILPDKTPIHDVEISSVNALLDLGQIADRPSLEQCTRWWDEWGLPENIRRHVTTVGWIAYVLAIWIRDAGIEVDPILTHRGGLMHDLDKIKTLGQQGEHGKLGADFLHAKGFRRLAEIVRGHLLQTMLLSDFEAVPWETKLVNYCDKLVEGDRIVPLSVRLASLKARYPDSRDLIRQAEPQIWALNQEICSRLAIQNHEKLIAALSTH